MMTGRYGETIGNNSLTVFIGDGDYDKNVSSDDRGKVWALGEESVEVF